VEYVVASFASILVFFDRTPEDSRAFDAVLRECLFKATAQFTQL